MYPIWQTHSTTWPAQRQSFPWQPRITSLWLRMPLRQAGSPPADEPLPVPAVSEAPAGGRKVRALELSIKDRATSLEHLLTHYPKNPQCPTCMRAKMQSAQTPNRAKRPSDSPTEEPVVFGDQFTCDSGYAQAEVDTGLGDSKIIMVCKDRATEWVDSYCVPNRGHEFVVEVASFSLATSSQSTSTLTTPRKSCLPSDSLHGPMTLPHLADHQQMALLRTQSSMSLSVPLQ